MGKKGNSTTIKKCLVKEKVIRNLPIQGRCVIYGGSITLETALVLPIFLMVTISLFSMIEIVNEYTVINSALYQVGREMAFYSYPYTEISEDINLEEYGEIKTAADIVLGETYVKTRLIEILGISWLDKSMVKGGALGLKVYRSEILDENNYIDLVVTYKVKPWFSSFGIGEFYLVNRCKVKAWLGYSEETDKDDVCDTEVYVAENGEVYHLYKDCTHILLSITAVGKDQVDTLRNESGDRYYECEYCAGNSLSADDTEYLYIADWGQRYHTDISCQGLKRTVYTMKLSETNGLPLCSKCRTREGALGNG